MEYTITAAAAFGLESVVKNELRNIGVRDAAADNGRVEFKGSENTLAEANVFLRAADRVYIKLKSFPCTDFDMLFDGAKSIPWGDLITADAAVIVDAKCVQSKLFAESACQSILKKAIIERLAQKYKRSNFPETGEKIRIDLVIRKDTATLSVDTSGAPLHKRGYRTLNAKAPLKETMAAGLIMLANFKDEYFLDPFCGSGTLPIEAAMIAKNIAPGANREFSFEKVHGFKEAFKNAKEKAKDGVREYKGTISGFDIDKDVISLAQFHAKNLGLEKSVHLQQSDMRALSIKTPKGIIVTNPPYAERIGEKRETENLYKDFYKLYSGMDRWKCFVLCGHPEFQNFFAKADKVRKLYNGGLECGFYSYFKERI